METINTTDKNNTVGSEFLTFTLGSEEYGMDILKVQEIRGYDAVTTLANTPAFIKGVINLRGSIIPIVDLRIRFNLGTIEYNQLTVVVILNLGMRMVGVVVDSVSDVLSLMSEQIRQTPNLTAGLDSRYITGLGTVGERMLILVDIEKLMNGSEMALTD